MRTFRRLLHKPKKLINHPIQHPETELKRSTHSITRTVRDDDRLAAQARARREVDLELLDPGQDAPVVRARHVYFATIVVVPKKGRIVPLEREVHGIRPPVAVVREDVFGREYQLRIIDVVSVRLRLGCSLKNYHQTIYLRCPTDLEILLGFGQERGSWTRRRCHHDVFVSVSTTQRKTRRSALTAQYLLT